jgi:hypothetical protein
VPNGGAYPRMHEAYSVNYLRMRMKPCRECQRTPLIY